MRFSAGDWVRVREGVRDKKCDAYSGYEGQVTEVASDERVTVDFHMFQRGPTGPADGKRTVPVSYLKFDPWSPKFDAELDTDS